MKITTYAKTLYIYIIILSMQKIYNNDHHVQYGHTTICTSFFYHLLSISVNYTKKIHTAKSVSKVNFIYTTICTQGHIYLSSIHASMQFCTYFSSYNSRRSHYIHTTMATQSSLLFTVWFFISFRSLFSSFCLV